MDPIRPKALHGQVLMAEDYYRQGLETVREARSTPAGDARRSAFARAGSLFSTVLEIDPNFRGARTNLGYCFIEIGRHGDAKREIERAIREFPDDASALINYAVILEYNHRSREAEGYLRRAILADPGQASAYRDLAYLLEHQRKYRAAADNLGRYLALDPHANDERPVRQRIKLLRQRSVVFEFPDRTITVSGASADLRMRALGFAIDASLWVPVAVFVESLVERSGGGHVMEPVWMVTAVLGFQTLSAEFFSGTIGGLMTRTKVAEERIRPGFSARALREVLRSGPILLSLLLPWPVDVITAATFAAASAYTAISQNEGQTWFDRITSTRVIESDNKPAQFLAIGVWLAIMILALTLGRERLLNWFLLRFPWS
ncbi:MAG: tetratricopeptide repeat protein [Acidobacteria bacterium]|nr:tetratricopeptide repeat protein [Acidobacteriota bacterium]